MNIFQSIARRLTGKPDADAYLPKERKVQHDKSDVLANPERYNRASRRAAGYLKPVWVALMKATAGERFLPRTARRHNSVLFNAPKTRRQRRHKARVTRALARRGTILA